MTNKVDFSAVRWGSLEWTNLARCTFSHTKDVCSNQFSATGRQPCS